MLQALFKLNNLIYRKCLGTGKPRYIKFNFSEERTSYKGEEFFRIKGQYIDNNSKGFSKAIIVVPIQKFQGLKPIYSLKYFPFKYHPNIENEKRKLIKRGQKFTFLKGKHYQQYKGNTFYIDNRQPVKIFINSRIIINTALF